MANRAYLYAADEPPDIWRHPDEPYCGSPWVIPLAWFFFYEAADIRMVPVHYKGSSWREVKLVVEKQRAVRTFSARQRLLPSTTNQRVDMDAVLTFLTAVKNWPGLHLLLDPGECSMPWRAMMSGTVSALG